MSYAYEVDEDGNVRYDSRKQPIPKSFKSGKLGYRLSRHIRKLETELTEHRQSIYAVEAKKQEFMQRHLDTLSEEERKKVKSYKFTDEELEELKPLQEKVFETAGEIITYDAALIDEDMVEGGNVHLFFRAPWVFDPDFEGEPESDDAKAAETD